MKRDPELPIPEILLVEDNSDYVRLMQEAFDQEKIPYHLNVAEDGVEAVDYLKGNPPFEKRLLPQIIFLDLRMPRKDGIEVLKEIKEDPQLKMIPVIIMTTSNSDKDLYSSYGYHANCFIIRPILFQEMRRIIRSIYEFWFQTVTLPSP